jgi:hypothetical protein
MDMWDTNPVNSLSFWFSYCDLLELLGFIDLDDDDGWLYYEDRTIDRMEEGLLTV